MTRVNRSWMAVVAAALLLGTLVGVVWARPNDRPGSADSTRKITLAGADFIANQNWDYTNEGPYVQCLTGYCLFTAPVVFPTLGAVTVERIRLHVHDQSDVTHATATLYRTIPSTGAVDQWAAAASPDGPSGGLRTYPSTAINKVVWPSQRAYIWLWIGGSMIDVYGVTVEYHRNL